MSEKDTQSEDIDDIKWATKGVKYNLPLEELI